MYRCNVCGGNCDCGELVGGVCLECREEQNKKQLSSTQITNMMNSSFYQMNLEDFISGREQNGC